MSASQHTASRARAPWWRSLSLLLPGLGLLGCQPEPPLPHPARFEEITGRAGLSFVHDPGARGEYRMPEHIGSGVALLDVNNDGRLDIYLVQNGGPDRGSPNRLFLQQEDGTYQDVGREFGADLTGWGMGAYAGDVNNDGWSDLLVTEYGAVRLLLNRAGEGFIEADANLRNPRWATAASFVDYDRDGWLDIVIGNYVDFDPTHECYDPAGRRDYCGPERAPPTLARLFHNEGTGSVPEEPRRPAIPRFRDVTLDSGLVHHPGQALGIACLDFNRDRWPDILLADDMRPNRLFINQKDGTFAEEAASRGIGYTALGQVAADMGVAVGDVDHNGLFDVFISHLSLEFHTLWLQESPGLFRDRSAQAGLTELSPRTTGFGTLFGDFNLDGHLDLALVNGRIKRGDLAALTASPDPALPDFWKPYAQPAQLFQNDGNGCLVDVSTLNPTFRHPPRVGRGLASGDLDNDGRLDLVETAIAGPARLHRNVTQTGHHWLWIRAILPEQGGRDAIGAEIRLHLGPVVLPGYLQPSLSYLSSLDPRVHFGLGTHTRYQAVTVLWPDGRTERFPGGAADRIVTLAQGEGTAVPSP